MLYGKTWISCFGVCLISFVFQATSAAKESTVPRTAENCDLVTTFQCAKAADEGEDAKRICIPKAWVCDGDNDCPLGEDEKQECHRPQSCERNQFECPAPSKVRCIAQGWTCDGEKDCDGGEDELPSLCMEYIVQGSMVDTFKCPPNHYRCPGTRSCIHLIKVCDGMVDCKRDGADEGPHCINRACRSKGCPNGMCKETSQGARCYCEEGRGWNGTNCQDINECDYDHYCDQGCVNTDGSYQCSCQHGYTLLKNHLCHIPDSPKPKLVLANYNKVYLVDIAPGTSKLTSGDYAVRGRQISTLDVDVSNNSLCWITFSLTEARSKMMCAKADDSKVMWEIKTQYSLDSVKAIAKDWISGNWYFADETREMIFVCTPDGQHCMRMVASGIRRPKSLAIDATKGFLFYADWSTSHIDRVDLDGSHLHVLAVIKMVHPNGLTLDLTRSHVYWGDSFLNVIERFDYDGRNRMIISKGSDVSHVFGMTILENYLYVANHLNNSVVRIHRYDHNVPNKVMLRAPSKPGSIKILHPVVQPISLDMDVCNKNASCEQMCIPVPNRNKATSTSRVKAKCVCWHGFLMNDTGHCVARTTQDFILMTNGQQGMVHFINPNLTKAIVDLYPPIANLGRPIAVAFDSVTGYVYFSDLSKPMVGRRKFDSQGEAEVFVTNGLTCDGLAVDWVGRNLYCADSGHQQVVAISLANSSMITTVLNTDTAGEMIHPKAIALDLHASMLYFSDWVISAGSGNASINRVNLDGTGFERIQHAGVQWPNGLTLDREAGVLYWTDAYYDRIESVKTDKTDRQAVHNFTTNQHPYGLALMNGSLLWAESMDGSLMTLNLTSDKLKAYQLFSPPIFDVKYYSKDSQPHIDHVCSSTDRGGCSDLCLMAASGGHVCQCADGRSSTDNGTTCSGDFMKVKCHPHRDFTCKTGDCVPFVKTCDGSKDCPDGSDEDKTPGGICESASCPDMMFQCNNSGCIYASFVCDGEIDCDSGDDEVNCHERTCPPNHFQCSNGQCYPETWKCDGDKDCPDGSDESSQDCCPNGNCHSLTCGADTFKCMDGQCIKYEYRCDNEYDCTDLSDELDCGEWCDPVREFKCVNMSHCLPKVFKCDGIPHCPDGSDERNCENVNPLCNEDEFACLDGTCLKSMYRCDSQKDCIDGSDEINCAKNSSSSSVLHCHWTQFMCDDKSACIPSTWQCDDDNDCKDRSDEKHCAKECPLPKFSCLKHSTMCLDPSKLCDNVNDCPDHSDEGRLCEYDLCLNHDCEYKCHRSPYGFGCSCPDNKRLKDDQKTCIDINICEQWGICSQQCAPTASGYRCHCLDGYTLEADNYSCKPNDKEPEYIIYLNRHQIHRINRHNNSVVSLIQSLQNAIAIDFHYEKSLLIWTDVLDDMIYRGEIIANTVGKTRPIVQYGLTKAEGIAVDWISDTVYWIDGNVNQIEVATIDGAHRTTLMAENMTSPRALVLDPRVGKLFWSDWDGNHPRIETCSLAGEPHTRAVLYDIRNNKGSGWPNGMTVDFETKRIYWADARSDSIHSITYEGTDHRLILKSHRYLNHPFSITQFGHNIFWTDWNKNSLVMANKFNGSNITVIQKTTYSQPFDLQIFHPKRQPQMKNPCENSPCSHLCLIGDGLKPVCRCPHRFKMSADNKNCKKDGTFLLFAKEKEIRGVDLGNAHYNVIPSISAPFVENASSIDYDIQGDRLYWTDAKKSIILSAFMNGTGVTTVIDSGLSNPSGFSIDWLSRNMYFASHDAHRAAISVAQLDGAYRKEIFNKTLGQINSIALDPSKGLMYWSDVGTEPAVWRARMDGGDAAVLASGSHGVVKPTSLSLDSESNRLYWIDTGAFVWCSLDIATTDANTKCTPTVEAEIPAQSPVTMTIYNHPESDDSTTKDFIFYSQSNIVKYENGQTKILQKNTPRVNDLKVYDPRIRQGTNGCSDHNGGCSQLCLPSGPTLVCACTVGFVLNKDNNKQCTGIESFLLYSMTSEIRGLTIEKRHPALAPISKISRATSIDFHNDFVYWVDSDNRHISRIKRDLSERETIVSDGISGAESLALDWMSGHVYWTDLGHNIIETSLLNGSNRYVVISDNLEKPRSLVLNPKLGYMYFADWGSYPRIVRAFLDGTGVVDFVESTHTSPVSAPYGLAIDYSNDDLYWCDKDLNFIEKVSVEGVRSKVVTSNLTDCMSLAIYGDYLFWADRTDLGGSIKYVNKTNGAGQTVLLKDAPLLKDITMYDAAVQTGTNPCSENNGGCAELCFYRGEAGGVVCACSHGKLKADKKACEDYDGFLLYSEVTSLKSLPLHSEEPNAPLKPIQNEKRLKNVIGLSFDYSTQRIFFSDIQKGNIQSVFFNGTGYTYILQGVGSAEGLAFEPMEKQLYWTSYSGSNINRITFPAAGQKGDPSTKVVLQLSADDHPRDIVVNPCIRRIYWTNWNLLKPSIQSATYIDHPAHGQKAVVDVQSLITDSIKVPNGLTIDHKGQKLYWSDARMDKIEVCNMYGENRQVIVEHIPRHTFGLAVHGQHLYWTDWLLRAVYRVNKYDGGDVTRLKANIDRQPMGLIAVSEETDDCTLNPCYDQAYGCSHFCLVDAEDNPRCFCPKGLVLLGDARRCVVPSAVESCSPSDFVCTVDNICVSFEKTCDGVADCPDGTDEQPDYCSKRSCKEEFFGCHASHRCIPADKLCNKQYDCPDGSDETDCPCADNEFRCTDGKCILAQYRCDDDTDCVDLSDEIGCFEACHKKGLISCNTTSKCILPSWICDGTNDCWDNNDETNCDVLFEYKCTEESFVCGDGKCISKQYRCDREADCQDGSDEVDCENLCGPDQHRCANNKCIPFSMVCDGHPDCPDLSDEPEECETKNCTSADKFQCPKGRCIKRDWLCDRETDCPNGEDERTDTANCDPVKCNEDQFMCMNRICIAMHYYCDGENDCEDGSDEPAEICVYEACGESEFQCKNEHKCIKGSKRCNGIIDCSDHTDEMDCDLPINGCANASQFECVDKKKCIDMTAVCNGHEDCLDSSDEPLSCNINECAFKVPLCSQLCVDKPNGYECQCHPGYQMMNVSLHNDATYPDKKCFDVNECETTFPCSHYCTNTVGSFKCSCPDEYTFMPDQRSCRVSDGITPQLLVTNRNFIHLININHKRISTLSSKLKNSVAVDYDWQSQTVYWTDISNSHSSISRMACNFTNHTVGPVEVLHSQTIRNPDGLAVDWVGRNLYWCDKTTDTIEVSTLDGLYRKVLLRDGLKEPRALEVFPQKGLMFITDWGDMPFIGRLNMDGTEFKVIINESLTWPNALTIDYVTEKIFWGDGNLDYIGMADLNGQNRRVIIGEGKKMVPHVFALTTFENQLYWTDWDHISVFSAKKFSGQNPTKVISLQHKPMDIHVVHPLRQQPVKNQYGLGPCDLLHCSHLCLLHPGKTPADSLEAMCACPEYHFLDKDAKTCISNCTSSQFLCETSSKCIHFWWRCDRFQDCPDGSDEPDTCGPYHCSEPGMFQCASASSEEHCLQPTQICDGKPQCEDKSDEAICATYTCMEHMFKCKKDNKCIPKTWLCDDEPHCSDGEDETNCTVQKCPEFTCASGQCVPYSWKCDKDNDCGDGSDEPLDCHNVTCKPDHIQCKSSGKCILESWKCDGERDCGQDDLSDEDLAECHELTCPPDSYRCIDGHCIPEKWRCDFDNDCRDGTDEIDCRPKNCTASQHRCGSGKCIPATLRCNGAFDCADRSDEKNCSAQCEDNQFKCLKHPECILKKWQCDGDTDCNDGTDEWNCHGNCSEHEFRCTNDLCISKQFVCDGDDDCKDNSDENPEFCAERACPPGRFRCRSNKCIWRNVLCDTRNDCEEGEDEDPEMCSVVDSCTLPYFLCESHTMCLHPKNVCDGTVDCTDGSDEKGDFCTYLERNRTKFCDVNNGGCEQECEETKFGPQCSCKKPYKINSDGLTCSYIDPCQELSSCSQICKVNHEEMTGKPICSCLPGYQMIRQVNRCKALGAGPELLLPSPGNSLKMLTLEDEYHYDPTQFETKGRDFVLSMDIDVKSNTAFLINQTGSDYHLVRLSGFRGDDKGDGNNNNNNNNNNKRVKRDAQKPVELHIQDKNLFAMNSVAVDWINEHIYLTDATNRAIHVYNYNAERGKTVVHGNLGEPHTVTVDPIEGRIFWTDRSTIPKIESANLDGSERRVVVSTEIGLPSGIVVDIGKHWLYWADTKKHTVEAARYDGTGRTTIYSFQEDDPPLSVELFEDNLYVLTAIYGTLWKLDKFGHTKDRLQLLTSLHHTRDITIVQDNKQLHVSSNCSSGACHETQVCFNRPHSVKGYICLCPDGAKFRDNKCDFERPVSCDGYCKNNGVCSLSGKKLKCKCPPSHRGEKCEKPVCEDYCLNGGTCLPPTQGQGQPSCSCPDSFHGLRCENAPCVDYCHNGGACRVDLAQGKPICTCSVDHEGERCENLVAKTEWCPGLCHNNATCTREAPGYIVCHCKPGFAGQRCEKCMDLTCYNRGVCTKDYRGRPQCQCPAGLDPRTKCMKKMPCKSLCLAETAQVPDYCDCNCKPHYWAKDCSTCNHYCKHGTCSMVENRAKCQCDPYHEGERCDVCKCGSTGKCVEENGQFKCQCTEGYTGTNCESELAVTPHSGSVSQTNPVMIAVPIAVVLVLVIVILVVVFLVFKKRRRRLSQYIHKRMNASGDNLNVSNPVFMKQGDGGDEDEEDEQDEFQPLEGMTSRAIYTGDDSTNFANPMYEVYANGHESRQKLMMDGSQEENHNYEDPIQFVGTGGPPTTTEDGKDNTRTSLA